MNYFILVCGDEEHVEGRLIPAQHLASHRLQKCSWPLYINTSNVEKITSGDRCLIYLSGTHKNAQCFFASANIVEARKDTYALNCDKNTVLPKKLLKCLSLNQVEEYEPLSIRDLNQKVSLSKYPQKKLNTLLRGRCLEITKQDFEEICTQLKTK